MPNYEDSWKNALSIETESVEKIVMVDEKIYRCTLCGDTKFKSEKSFLRHFGQKHTALNCVPFSHMTSEVREDKGFFRFQTEEEAKQFGFWTYDADDVIVPLVLRQKWVPGWYVFVVDQSENLGLEYTLTPCEEYIPILKARMDDARRRYDDIQLLLPLPTTS